MSTDLASPGVGVETAGQLLVTAGDNRDRQANRALWRIALVRMGCHQPTKDYVGRPTAEGKTKTEIMRCVKRYIACEVFPHLLTSAPAAVSRQPDLRQRAS